MRPFRAACGAAVACAFVIFAPVRVFAADATSGQVRSLAQRAQSDPAALAELRRIDRVDGKQANIADALDHTTPGELRSRLASLADQRTSNATTDVGRADAREILSGRRFRQSTVPRPFRGILQRAGAALQRWFDPLLKHVPGRDATVWVILGSIVAGLAAWLAYRLGRRRRSAEIQHGLRQLGKSDRPEDLERAARDAEERGAHDEAIRLRFRAGLLRLGLLGAIEWRPSVTPGQVRHRLHIDAFDRVASSYELVAYGKRTPTQDDVEISKSGWQDVLHRVPS